jgi:DNA-binding NtrC family response regulator
MKDRTLNVYILNDNAEEAGKLRKYLLKRFGNRLNISLFFNRRSFFRMMDNHVDMVVVDDYHSHKHPNEDPSMQVLNKVKAEHPATEVVILTSHENVGTAIDAIKGGAREYILNKQGAWQSVLRVIDQAVTQPIRYLVAEYGVKVFVSVFILVWVILGLISYLALRFWV